ncbi:VC_2705 family sodium/solute symporter [Curvibacter sp. APW13]|uniref:VC_2705 family sodium/solute symporter n=1 Tax=Curvibacter sp. APW13 TaxID=3077236 RepID=UPI0028DDD446|nr:VC_2705 family sodium/solute symporter [Curvibacter sp. APW13]MDT8992115.1 VC_2705 family sodium/solute symporter [Curvibacter sp. APW13]
MSAGGSAPRWRLHAALLSLWFVASFVVVFFARDLQSEVLGWPWSYWFVAQGALCVFLVIVVVFAWRANRQAGSESGVLQPDDHRRYHRRFFGYVGSLLALALLLAVAEQYGLSRPWVAGIFLSATLVLYAAVGVYARTAEASEYYVAGRRIPAVYNGMAAAADWMSAASFISLAGGLYLQGFSGAGSQPGGFAYILGWTGGFCLVALLVAPYLRKMQLYTVPDYFAVRYGGRWPRMIAALATVLVSFVYVVAQIYGVGLITSRMTGMHFEIGILLGLGGVLVCSFLGGMRAVTWTQVTQYVLIMLAFMVPVSWLAYKQVGNPLAPLAFGQQLATITEMEGKLMRSASEQEVIEEYQRRAEVLEAQLQDVDASLQAQRRDLRQRLQAVGDGHEDDGRVAALRRELAALPKDVSAARERWKLELKDYRERAQALGGLPRTAQAFAGDPDGDDEEQAQFGVSRRNFLALVLCLMVGTAGLPHLLTRFYTTTSVAETRRSVAWSLVFIALLYLSAPALAVLVKYEVMVHLVGQSFDQLPAWVVQWSRDPSLLWVADVNDDKVLQFAEIRVGADLLMLASPEIGGLPYIVSVLVAAGGLAAALSTADGLLLTIGNALAHDVYFEGESSRAQAMRRVMWSKFALLVVALIAAYVAAQRPAGILYLVSASFSLAGAAFVPAMVLGIFWKGASRQGAVCGMLVGLGVTVYYMLSNLPAVRAMFGLTGSGLWFEIQPVSAGVFGVAAGTLATWWVSLRFPPPKPVH